MTNVKKLNNQQLIYKVKFLVNEEKKNIAAQITLLKEIRTRKLAVSLGYSNLISFCQQELGLTRDQAWKRSQAAGAAQKEPELLGMLKKGETSTSALALLAPKLTSSTAKEIKEFVPGKSKREVEAFVSTLNRDGSRQPAKQTIKLHLEVTRETAEVLHRARKILKQNKAEVSDDDLIRSAFELLLDKKDPQRKAQRAQKKQANKRQKQLASKTQRKDAPAPGRKKISKKQTSNVRSRYVPAKTRHQVHATSNYRCEYRNSTGKQCLETTALQMDHIKMFCQNGSHEINNLRLLCRTHNNYLAEIQLGKRMIE